MDPIDVYGIGNPLIDVVVSCSDDELAELKLAKGTMHLIEPERGEEILASLTHKEKQYSPGGSCPNTMIALANFGSKTALGGMVGTDELGGIYRDQLLGHGVHSNLSVHEGATGTSIVMVTPDSERTMNTHLGTCQYFSRYEVSFEAIDAAEYLHFTGYMWDTESQKDAILAAVAHAREAETPVVFDLADPFAAERNRDEFLELIRDHVDIVFANQREAELLCETADPQDSVRQLAKLAEVATVKDGASGSYIKERGGPLIEVPAATAEPVDTTGAGDIYAAGFLRRLCTGGSLQDAGAFASYAAAQIIEQVGAQFTGERRELIREAQHDGSWRLALQRA
jgi:sugar/nucleoside kinase (ribokinase family)